MKLSIGILAHDEASTIGQTLDSLLRQDVFADRLAEIEIVVVANGCRDQTAPLARRALRSPPGTPAARVDWRVCELAQAGKSNAWNHFVHSLSDAQSEFLVLMDADIRFPEPGTIGLLLEALRTHPGAWVSVDSPVKDIARRPPRSLAERLSVAVSARSPSDPIAVCGQLYCGRAEKLRRIWMPIGLQVEDGFVRAMTLTGGFTGAERPERIVRAPGATHLFEAYTNPRQLLRHEQWLVAGSVVNSLLFTYLWDRCGQGRDAGSLIRSHNEQDPQWLNALLAGAIARRARWLVPRELVFRRFAGLRRVTAWERVLRLGTALLALPIDAVVLIGANRRLRRGAALRYPWSAATTAAASD